MNQYQTLLIVLALWAALGALAAVADLIHNGRRQPARARHTTHHRHRAAPRDPYRNDYLIRRPARFPAPAKGWDRR